MGIPTTDPPAPGDSCALCDDILWPAGETPQFIKLTFTGVEKCPASPFDVPVGEYILEQDPDNACFYFLFIGSVEFGAQFELGSSSYFVKGVMAPVTWLLFQGQNGTCRNTASNILLGCGSNVGGKLGSVAMEIV